MTNFTLELHRLAVERPDATAILFRDTPYSYRQLNAAIWQMAAYLHRAGIRAGTVVGHTFQHDLTYVVCMLAVCRLGATVVSLPGHDPEAYRAEITRRCGVRYVLSDGPKASFPEITTLHINPQDIRTDVDDCDIAGLAPIAPSAPCQLIVGSGSTGRKKLLPITHTQLLARMRIAWDMLDMTAQDRVACMTSLDFVMCSHRLFEALSIGACFVLLEGTLEQKIATCRRNGVSMLNASVFHIEGLLHSLPTGTSEFLGFLRALRIGAATVTNALRARVMRQLTPQLYVRYASNEFGPATIARPDDVARTPGTVGRVDSRVQLKLTRPDGQPVQVGEAGQIWLKGPGMIQGYLDDPEATASAFMDGWFTPNDLGRLTPDGQLIYCGRADHMMIFNGINVYPAEIENAMASYPGVLDVACIPLKSNIYQDVPLCALTLAPGSTVSKLDLMRFAHEKLGPQRPREIVVLSKIPRTDSGKLLREDLMRAIAVALKRKRKEPAGSATGEVARPSIDQEVSQQPTYRFAVEFGCPATFAASNVDTWLKVEIGIPLDLHRMLPPRAEGAAEAVAGNLVGRAILLAGPLLQAGGIPAFDPGRLLNVSPRDASKKVWSATLELPRVELISVKCYVHVMQEAIRIVRWMASTPVSPKSRELLYSGIQRRIMIPIRKLIGGGKSTLPVLRAAHQMHIPFAHLGAGVFQLGWGSKARRIDRSTTGADSAIGAKLSRNKACTASLLAMAGLPAPKHELTDTKDKAMDVARRIGWPIVVKPVDGERGEGVTVGVGDEATLRKAFDHARASSQTRVVLVEQEVPGVCHRLFISNQRLLYAVKRLPKSVHGNGRQTVRELIQQGNLDEDNKPPWLRSESYPADELAQEAISNAGFTWDMVPQPGERVPLRNIESTQWGGFDEDVTHAIHPDNLDIALRATALFGLSVAGIDIITPDIRTPWHQNRAIINEVNFAPLLGGGEISRRHIPEFLKNLVPGDGRIPIEVILGNGAAWHLALDRQKVLANARVRCFVTSHETTLLPSGQKMYLPLQGLYERTRTLLLNEQVEALVLVVQTDEFLRTGLPVDRIDQLTSLAPAESGSAGAGDSAGPRAFEAMEALLKRHCLPVASKPPDGH